jgi:hypothetical protein
LSDDSPHIEPTAGRPGQRGYKCLKRLRATDATNRTYNRVAKAAEAVILEGGTRAIAADYTGDQPDDQIVIVLDMVSTAYVGPG